MNLIKHAPAAKLAIDQKFRVVFSQRSETCLKCLMRPIPCSIRARLDSVVKCNGL
jgi:hypothetical protein